MKTFVEFINESHLILEKRGGPSYNYEVALERLYNHLIKGDKRASVAGKKMRLAISKGDMDTITDIIAQELHKSKTDPKHPLHFDNASDEGFTGGKKTAEHRQSYYDNLKDQAFTILNDVQSRSGRSIGAKGYVAKRQGESKVELSKTSQLLYDKLQDTSKPDMVFQDPVRPERQSKTSLKKASGAVAASSGAEETYGNIGTAVSAAIKKMLKSGKITKEKADELRLSAMGVAGKIRNVMRGSKGQDQEKLLPQVDKLQGDLEQLIPGVSREVGIEQMSGKGKYGKAGGVDRYITTGKGGGTIEDPREFGIDQRARKGKGTTKTKEGPVQRPMAVTADIRKPTTGQPSSFAAFSKQAQQALAAAEAERDDAQKELETNSDGSRTLLQHQGQKRRNNPDLDARINAADQAVQTAHTTLADVQARAAQAAERSKSKPKPQSPQQPTEPQPTEPVTTKPQQPQSPQPVQPSTTPTQPTQSIPAQPTQAPQKKKKNIQV